jgi:aspartyl aminopeptidase
MHIAFIFLQLIAREANCEVDQICDFELQLCDTQPSIIAGAMKEFIFSGRLDNLCMSFCSLKVCLAVSVYIKVIETTCTNSHIFESTKSHLISLLDNILNTSYVFFYIVLVFLLYLR